MKKLQYSSALHNEQESDTTDVALRSLLPEEIPQEERERRGVGVPDNEDDYGNYDDPNNGRGGPNGAKFRDYRRRGDRLDLNSNLANTSLTNRDQLNKLNIEKQLDLKQQKTVVPKKEIRKYQNDPYSNKQLRDLGYSEKKVQNGPREGDPYGGEGYRVGSYNDPRDNNGRDPNDPNDRGDGRDPNDRGDGNDRGDPNDNRDRGRNYGYGDNRDGKRRDDREDDGENEPGYKVMRDNTYAKNPSQKQAIFVPINRKTVDPNEYRPVDTKLNGDDRRVRRGYGEDNGEDYEDPKKDRSRVYEYQPRPDDRSERDRELDRERERERERRERERERDRERDRKDNERSRVGSGGYYTNRDSNNDYHDHGIHPHECPDCHGFWCRTCGATIPPQYRPFWDEDESPEMVEFYKRRIRQERARERRQRGECKNCMHPASRENTEQRS